MNELFNAAKVAFKDDVAIARFQDDGIVVARLNAAMGAQGKRKVNGHRAGMKEVERPDIYSSSGQINTSRSR